MGNAATKDSEALDDAVRTLLHADMVGGADAAENEGERGEQEQVWAGVFDCSLGEADFYEVGCLNCLFVFRYTYYYACRVAFHTDTKKKSKLF